MHYMHYKDYIHHGLAAEKTPPPLPQGGEPSGWVGGGVGVPAHIYTYIYHTRSIWVRGSLVPIDAQMTPPQAWTVSMVE